MYSVFNQKAKKWIKGRKNIFNNLSGAIGTNNNIIWMHCASLGEFEQGRPFLESLRKEQANNYKILLTFFSPSGYENQKKYNGADYIFYLPMDSKSNAKRFIEIVQPKLIIFVKYEYWYYYLKEARLQNIPLLLISGIFRQDQPFFKWYGSLHREMVSFFTHLFVQNQNSAQLLATININKNVSVSGDTRFDRVIDIAFQSEPILLIEQFCGSSEVVIAGSTWTEDDNELYHFANTNPGIKFIIAPHNINQHRIDECQTLYKNSTTYSKLKLGQIPSNTNTLIIDNIGMLSRLYQYATVCYVGGAFGADGVHNVVEPAVFGKPIVFGPEYSKYFEARELIEQEAAFSITNALELEDVLKRLLAKDLHYFKACKSAKNYVYNKAGATQKIVNYIQEKRLLTN